MSDPDPYVSWLQRENEPLFYTGDVAWRRYLGSALIQASLKPQPIDLSRQEVCGLLRHSHARLIRWFSQTSNAPTSFWYILCDRYDFDSLSRKVRNQIRKASRECSIRIVEAQWLASNGYDCYAAAFGRYRHGRPITRQDFARVQGNCAAGPFVFFGAFVGDQLAGFAKCVELDDYVALSTFRFDPRHKAAMPSYALLHQLLRKYVVEERKTFGNGFVSLHDDTNMQDFLLKFGFRRVYCDLQIAYAPALGAAVRALYPSRILIDRLPSRPPITALKSLLRQEHVRRQCSAQLSRARRALSQGARPELGSAD